MKIMIVEDHADMRRMLNNIITNSFTDQVEVIECENGEEAILQYPVSRPDCVLMDIELKSMSGFKVIEEIYGHNADARVIMVTTYYTPTFRRKAEILNVKGFVSKDKLSDLQQLLSNQYNEQV
ncbi:MAG: response regulator transcription factor [Gracilimonas sp.]|nr:response regulator transcription factor [Gracilimonas sp.]